jgi:histidinol dehydrogenase
MRFFQYPKDAEAIRKKFLTAVEKHPDIERSVERIIASVRKNGDKAVLEFTRRFDHVTLTEKSLKVPETDLQKAWKGLNPDVREVIRLAAKRIRDFHVHQAQTGYRLKDNTGSWLEYRITPISSVGLYVPGGTAAYPSTLLMNAIPARIAGVKDIVIVTPPGPKGRVNPLILGTAWFLGLKNVYRVGGAQAVAALAFGTKTIPKVDKIAGPGNIYVATAKRMLYGIIDMDMIAGPSEILVIADSSAPLSFIVADLLSQAEHDPLSVAVLIYIGDLDQEMFRKELSRQLSLAPRKEIIRKSLNARGMILGVKTRRDAVTLANLKAPEHLEILVKNPMQIVPELRNAGALFVGPFTPETIGDYVAGTNHVLPTMGTARFFSPLSVSSFSKATSILSFTRKGLESLARASIRFAEEEGLPSHAQAVKIRMNSQCSPEPQPMKNVKFKMKNLK